MDDQCFHRADELEALQIEKQVGLHDGEFHLFSLARIRLTIRVHYESTIDMADLLWRRLAISAVSFGFSFQQLP